MTQYDRPIISRWGNAAADDHQYSHIPGWIMRHYHRFVYAGQDASKRGQTVGLTADEFQVMAHIMAFKYDVKDAAARPSLATVARQTGKSVSAVRRTVRRLREKGALHVMYQSGEASIYDFGELARQCWQFETSDEVTMSKPQNAQPQAQGSESDRPEQSGDHPETTGDTLSADATPSVDAQGTPSVDAQGTPSVDAHRRIEVKNRSKDQIGARKRTPAQQRLDHMVNALVEALGYVPETVTKATWSELRGAGKDLLDAGATPEDMPGLYAWCAKQGWSNTWGAFAMAKHWPNYVKQKQARQIAVTRNVTGLTAAQRAERALYGNDQGEA